MGSISIGEVFIPISTIISIVSIALSIYSVALARKTNQIREEQIRAARKRRAAEARDDG